MDADGRPVILLVDDEPLIAKLHGRAAEGAGFRPLIASSGAEALDSLEAGAPALVLTDFHMGDMSGPALAQALRSRGYDRPIILISGDDSLPLVIEGLECGVDDFLVKGMTFQRLIDRFGFWGLGPLTGLPAHARAAALRGFAYVSPIGRPVERLYAPATLLTDRAAATVRGLLDDVPEGFGRREVDLVRFLGVVDRVVALLGRTSGLVQIRRPDIVVRTIAGLALPFAPALHSRCLPRWEELAEHATFQHAAETLMLHV